MKKEAKKLTCKLCGTKYQGCATCMKSKDMYYSWRNVCCSAMHFGVYETLVDYKRKNVTKEEAREILFNRANDYDSYTETNRKIVEEILFEEDELELVEVEEIEIEEQEVEEIEIEEIVNEDLDVLIEEEQLLEENECN